MRRFEKVPDELPDDLVVVDDEDPVPRRHAAVVTPSCVDARSRYPAISARKLARGHRLGDEAVAARPRGLFRILLHRLGRERHDRHGAGRLAGLEDPRRLQPVHAGQGDVHEDEIGLRDPASDKPVLRGRAWTTSYPSRSRSITMRFMMIWSSSMTRILFIGCIYSMHQGFFKCQRNLATGPGRHSETLDARCRRRYLESGAKNEENPCGR